MNYYDVCYSEALYSGVTNLLRIKPPQAEASITVRAIPR